MLDISGSERWSRLPGLLSQLGVRLTAQPADPDMKRSWAIMHVLSRICSAGSRGFYHFDDHIKFDTGDRCGGLSGDPESDAINGHNLYSDIDAAYAAIDQACKVNGTVTF